MVESTIIDVGTDRKISCHWVKNHTVFVGLKDILPEDILWRERNPSVPAMICLQKSMACSCTFNCMPKLAKRCHWFFDKFPELEQLFVLFQRQGESALRRSVGTGNMSREEASLESVQKSLKRKSIPRIHSLVIDGDFNLRLVRSNYDGLQLVLGGSRHEAIEVPCDFYY